MADSDSTNDCFTLLGICYNPSEDYFSFKINLDEFKKPITKRMVVSSISKLFDPLGWLAPVMITAKVIIQKMWLAKLQWEDTLQKDLKNEFLEWYNSLIVLNTLKIPRWIGYTTDAKYEIFGFADASKLAYAACVYLKVTVNGQSTIRLLQGKSKVSPIKPLLTIPKLELSAASLLAKLTVKVLNSLKLPHVDIYLFTDSIDVLFWLKEHPSKWPVFVAHKCSHIHSLVPTAYWSHVRSKENPADCVSRGISPEQLLGFNLWWEGNLHIQGKFQFNHDSRNFHTSSLTSLNCSINNEIKKAKIIKNWELLDKYSDVKKLFRVMSFVLRFLCNVVSKLKTNLFYKFKLFNLDWFNVSKKSCLFFINAFELNRAKLVWVYLVQNLHFVKEIKLLDNSFKFTKSRLIKLDPFLEKGLLRLGGRIHFSLLSYEQQHPFILPYDSKFSKLLVHHYHKKSFHGGIRLTLSTIRQEFWIIRCI